MQIFKLFVLQLRYLQTLNSISAEHNSTIVFPVPIDIISQLVTDTQVNSVEPAVTELARPDNILFNIEKEK